MTYWTEEREVRAAKLWKAGQSAAEIAQSIGGGLSRAAVCGKMFRLGLSRNAESKGGGSLPKRRPKPQKAMTAPTVKKAHPNTLNGAKPPKPAPATFVLGPGVGAALKPPLVYRERDEPAGAATVLTVRSFQCRWPIGDPQSDAFTFCGSKQARGPYCADHAARAYQPQSTAKKHSTQELIRSTRRFA